VVADRNSKPIVELGRRRYNELPEGRLLESIGVEHLGNRY
jgi:hypothetical protein